MSPFIEYILQIAQYLRKIVQMAAHMGDIINGIELWKVVGSDACNWKKLMSNTFIGAIQEIKELHQREFLYINWSS